MATENMGMADRLSVLLMVLRSSKELILTSSHPEFQLLYYRACHNLMQPLHLDVSIAT